MKSYYGINAQEAITPEGMFNLGFSYGGKSVDQNQNQDLRFYWYYKAVINGYKSGYNNLGVCYHDGAGVERDYEKANEYFLMSIEYENNSEVMKKFYDCGIDLGTTNSCISVPNNNNTCSQI